MKKLLTFAVLCMFMLGSMAYATNTRVMTMGETNDIVKDEANIWLYPSTINYYPNLFIGEYEVGDELYEIGAHFLFCEDSEKPMVLGFYFSEEEYLHEIMDMENVYDDDAGRGINLFYGREISAIPFGFFFGYWFDSYKNEDSLPDVNMEWSMTRYDFKVGISPMSKKLDLSAGIALTTWTDMAYYDATHGVVDLTTPDGNMELSCMARYWMDPICNRYTLIPHAEVFIGKEGLESYYEDGSGAWVVDYTVELKETMLGLGLGMNYDAGADVLVVGDFGFNLDNSKITQDYVDNVAAGEDDYESEEKVLILPYFKLGIDAKVFDWMDLRAGVVTEWERWKYESTSDWQPFPFADSPWDRSAAEPYTDLYLGAGFNWGNFTIDASINPDFLGHGPYFISGDYTSDLAERVSLKYAF